MKTNLLRLTIIILILINTFKGRAQTVKQDSAGIYYTAKASETAKDSGRKFRTQDGQILPIYQTEKGKFYVIRTSKKTNKQYKSYLKLN